MEGTTIRVINGIRCVCRDVGCDDFEKARQSRERVKSTYYDAWWEEMKAAINHTPLGQSLASWIPVGDLPRPASKATINRVLAEGGKE